MNRFFLFLALLSAALMADLLLGTRSHAHIAILGGLINSIFNDSSSMYDNAISELQDRKRDMRSETSASQLGTQRSSYQDAINRTMEELRRQNSKLSAASVVTGGTDESLQAQKESNALAMAKGMSDAAVRAEAQDEAARRDGRQREDAVDNQILDMSFRRDKAKSDAIAGVAAGLDAAEGIALGGLFSSLFDKKG